MKAFCLKQAFLLRRIARLWSRPLMRFRNAPFFTESASKSPRPHYRFHSVFLIYTKTLEYVRKRYNSVNLGMRQIDASAMFAMRNTSAFSKANVFAVDTNTIGLRFQMSSFWTASSNVRVFDENDQRLRSL